MKFLTLHRTTFHEALASGICRLPWFAKKFWLRNILQDQPAGQSWTQTESFQIPLEETSSLGLQIPASVRGRPILPPKAVMGREPCVVYWQDSWANICNFPGYSMPKPYYTALRIQLSRWLPLLHKQIFSLPRLGKAHASGRLSRTVPRSTCLPHQLSMPLLVSKSIDGA